MHLDQLPTGNPVVGHRRSFGTLHEQERFGIGIVGLHEGHTLLVALRSSGLCRPVMGCDLSEEKRLLAEEACPGLPTTADYGELLANEAVQIVAIYTPDSLHADQIRRAFEAGKHVICTKPLINDIVSIPELLQAARQSGRRLQVGQSTRFYEPFLRQRERYEAGLQGEVEAVDAHYHHRMDWYYEKSPWTVDTTHWAYLGLSHPVDLVRWYLGEISAVQAVGTNSALANRYGLPTPDVIAVNLVGANGKIGRAFGHYGIHELGRARALIECFLMGGEGTSLARYPDLRFTYHDEQGIEVEEDYHHAMAGYYYRHELKGMHYGEFCNYADYFAAKLISGEPNSPDLEEGLQTVLVMNAIVRALESGETVRVRPLTEIGG
ncbi:MAG: Inositol 2-dehydrogenase/D-chiro-inositol 3-dehydrogenase [Fimbriimonadaceae bacterium]|nr:Inositol 2-dehydrogenase/D-chiro-inositol 3-dehydrogenase [Fimbriimonadaceae bacterium]